MTTDPRLEAFLKALDAYSDARLGQKAPTGVPTTNCIHGPGGLFGATAFAEQVISGRIVPMGISNLLKAIPSVYAHPIFAYITGVTSDGTTGPTGECATCPSGVTQACIQTAQFGFYCNETKELTPNRAIERLHQGDVDMVLLNSMVGDADVFKPVTSWSPATLLNVATQLAMLEVGILLQQQVAPHIWQGNPANSLAAGYAEFPGLDILIGTNKVDVNTGVQCQALNSDVKEFGYQQINVVDAAGNFLIVAMLEAMEAYIYHVATRTQLMPAKWAFAMRPEMWYELCRIWPIAYHTTRGMALPAGNTNFIDATAMTRQRDAMMAGMTITLNGRTYPVTTDDGILEHDSTNNANVPAGSFASSVYMVPLTFLGSRNATYIEHKDYRKTNVEAAALKNKQDWWTDDGRFLWAIEPIKWCYTLSAKIEPRVILRVPQIAGRLDHIMITPRQHFRSPWEDSDYFLKGGQSSQEMPSFYSDWNLPEALR